MTSPCLPSSFFPQPAKRELLSHVLPKSVRYRKLPGRAPVGLLLSKKSVVVGLGAQYIKKATTTQPR